jgi:hypothetical protein
MDEQTQSLDAIMDQGALGPDPSDGYLASLEMLDHVVRECIVISREHGGIASPTGRHFYASVLFTLMITKSVSLLTLAPHTPWASKRIEHWDYGSMTGIARTMIELRIAYYYLCVEECSEDEWQVRWNLLNLHDCMSRARMFEAIENAEQASSFKAQAEELRERLTSNSYFQSLDPRRHKKLLHGQTAYLFSLEAISERAGIDLRTFRWLYVLFSSHVHALPMSFYRICGDNPDRGRGLPSPPEENYSALCLSLSATLLVRSRDEFLSMFAEHKPSKPAEPATADQREPSAIAVGEETILDVSDDVALRLRRPAEEVLETTYIYRTTGDPVLERVDHENGDVDLAWVDPVFWTFSVNGRPATEALLERAFAGNHAHRVDHLRREILVKTALHNDHQETPDEPPLC